MRCSFAPAASRPWSGRARLLGAGRARRAIARAQSCTKGLADAPHRPCPHREPVGPRDADQRERLDPAHRVPRRDAERVPRQRAGRRPGESRAAPPRGAHDVDCRCSARAARARSGSTTPGSRSEANGPTFASACRSASPKLHRPGSGTCSSRTSARAALTFDLLHVQDLVLADYGMVRLNEYYASQYVDYTPLAHPSRGVVLAVRQNLSIGGRHPWALFGSLGRATHFATDALSYYGLAARATGAPAAAEAEHLPSERCQHEHSMAVIQDEPVSLAPGAHAARGFFAWLELDHPDGELGERPRVRRARARAAGGEAARRNRARRASPARPRRRCSPRGRCSTRASSSPRSSTRCSGRSAARPRRRRPRCCRSSTAPTRTSCCRRRSARACAATARSCARGTRWCPTRRRSPRRSGWAACSTRWSRRATSASIACSRPRTATSACSARTASASSSSSRTAISCSTCRRRSR